MVLPSDHHIYTVHSASLCGLYDILLQDQQFSGTVWARLGIILHVNQNIQV